MYKDPTPNENADDLSFPIIYHTVVYPLHSATDSQYNIIPNLLIVVTHNFPPKWFPWKPMSYDMSTILFLARKRNMLKIGLKLMTLESEVDLFSNIFNKPAILPLHTCVKPHFTVIFPTEKFHYDTNSHVSSSNMITM